MNDKSKERFIERMGLVFQADGMPRIAGRLFGYFVIHGGTHSFSELADVLQVSRGSVSTNARTLESLGMLRKTARPGDRQDYFRLEDDAYGRLLRGHVERLRQNAELVAATLQALPQDDPSCDRLLEMQRFYEIVTSSVSDGLANWADWRARNIDQRLTGND